MTPRKELISERFEVNIDRMLGKGGFGDVYRALDTLADPPLEVAAKRGSPESLRQEAQMLEIVGRHPSIIGQHGYVETGPFTAWMFVDYIGGGELFDRLIDSGNLSERATRPIAANIASALEHCLSRGVVHRDVKLENVMLCAEDPNALKLIDFGLATRLPLAPDGAIEPSALRYDGVGSRSWKAPELFFASAGYFPPPVDAWAYGVLVFSLLAGFFPFDEARSTDWRFARLAQDQARGVGPCDSIFGMYKRSCPFSRAAKEFVDALLWIDPTRRATIGWCLDHEWIEEPEPSSTAASAEGVVYRSSADGVDWGIDTDDEPLPLRLPDGAPRLTRQAAGIGPAPDVVP